MYLIMNVAVGGVGGYFPDDVDDKPWTNDSPRAALDFWNAKDAWFPTWPKDNKRALAVDYVKMWRQC